MEKKTLPWFAISLGAILIVALIAAAILLPKDDGVSYQKPGSETVPSSSEPTPPPPEPPERAAPEVPEIEIISVTPEPVRNATTIEGRARGFWFFEASFPIELYDSEGVLLDTAIAQAEGDWMTTEFVPFRATLHFPPPVSSQGKLVLKKDNPSGLPEHDQSIERTVKLLTTEKQGNDHLIYLGFISEKDAGTKDCTKVLSAVRVIPKTPAIAKATLEELLKGPTIGEVGDGMLTIIPSGTKLNSILIKNGIATADFNEKLHPGGGSCAVSAIRAQIEETLKQFPSIDDVVISVNGQTEGVLEP